MGAALAGVVGVGLVSGSYPAFVLSGFQPARVLQGSGQGTTGDRRLRQGLVVVQFVVAVGLLIGVGVILRQFNYMQTQNLGFTGERVLVADLRGLPDSLVTQRASTIKQELSAHRSIQQAALTNGVPGRQIAAGIVVSAEGLPSGETRDLRRYSIDPDYLETLDIQVVAGRNFRPEDADVADPAPALVNETAVETFGWSSPEAALGKQIQRPTSEGPYRVVGVVEDYHHFSLRQRIEPVYIRLAPQAYEYAALRVAPGQTEAAVDYLRQTWNRLYPAYPSDYFFLDDDFDRQYRAEQRLATLFGSFAGLALVVACLGLLGLAAFTAQRRAKEMSIRKVLGAPVAHIVTLLSKDFLKLVGVAFVIAAPLAYLGAQRWLQGFAYPAELGPWLFLGAGLAVALLALATVSVHSIRAALVDPAKTLQQE
jgi:putative ABC transport system permease protein